jgi:hypothetical protein
MANLLMPALCVDRQSLVPKPFVTKLWEFAVRVAWYWIGHVRGGGRQLHSAAAYSLRPPLPLADRSPAQVW